MAQHRCLRAIALFLGMVLAFIFVPGLHADQSMDEAIAILTYGRWYFGGPGHMGIWREFHRDGTYVSGNPTSGTWKITRSELDISWGTGFLRFSLPINPNGTPGFNGKGRAQLLVRECAKGPTPTPGPAAPEVADRYKAPPEAVPTPTPPIPADIQQSASALIQTYHDSLVFVTGTAAAGSGFIATVGSANYLITNVHVAAGIRDAAFRTLDGAAVRGGAASMAVGEDIFCMAVPSAAKPLPVMQGVDTNAAVGDAVVVLGNADGQGVVNTIVGKIVGIGPNLVEIDAPFVPGNSGSPIIHLKTGKVIGVATYLVTNQYDLTTNKKLARPVVRRFGYRIDSVKGWQAVNMRIFYGQADEMESIEGLTDDLYDFFRDLDENHGGVTLDRHTNPVIKGRIDDWVAEKGSHPSAEDATEADENFISFLKIACRSDVAAAQRQINYDYFVRQLADQKQTRDQMAGAFEQIIRNLGQ